MKCTCAFAWSIKNGGAKHLPQQKRFEVTSTIMVEQALPMAPHNDAKPHQHFIKIYLAQWTK